MAHSVVVSLVVIPAGAGMDYINHPACCRQVDSGLRRNDGKGAKTLPGDRVLLAFINAAEAVQIAVAAGLLADRADSGAAVAVVLREAR